MPTLQATLSESDSFVRTAGIEPIVALPDHFSLQFNSVLRTARNPQAVIRNFEVFLERPGLLALRDLLDAALKA